MNAAIMDPLRLPGDGPAARLSAAGMNLKLHGSTFVAIAQSPPRVSRDGWSVLPVEVRGSLRGVGELVRPLLVSQAQGGDGCSTK